MCQNIPSFFPSGAIRRKNIKVFVIFLILFVLAFVLTTFNLTQHSNHSLSRTNSIGIPNKFLYFKNFISAKNTSQVRKDEKWRQVRILCFVITYPKNLGKIKNELFTLLLKNPPLEEYLVRSVYGSCQGLQYVQLSIILVVNHPSCYSLFLIL